MGDLRRQLHAEWINCPGDPTPPVPCTPSEGGRHCETHWLLPLYPSGRCLEGAPQASRTEGNAFVEHTSALVNAGESVLRDFGDEYEGRLAPLREAVDAYLAWLVTDDAVPAAEGRE